jgi:outer membrane protein insertion porin family
MPPNGREPIDEMDAGRGPARRAASPWTALGMHVLLRPRGARILAPLALAIALAAPAAAQVAALDDETLADRPISKVVFKGLDRVTEREILNNIRVAAGQPFEAQAVRIDVSTLYRLGQFDTVDAIATVLPDGSVELTYVLVEQPIVRDLQVVGNKLISDQELRKAIPLYAGGPRDDFLLEQSVTRIKDLYRKRGHYLAEVTVDENLLKDSGILILRIVEGPRVKVKEILFVGNESFEARELSSEIKTGTAVPLFGKGELDEDRLVDDVAALDKFYKDRGFVDVRVDRRIEISSDSKEAKVVFVVSEGRRYRLRNVVIEGLGAEGPKPLGVLEPAQIEGLLFIHRGDIYSRYKIDKSIASVRDAYFLLGHVDVAIADKTVRVGAEPEVDLLLSVREGPRTIAGLVNIQGNFLTKDKVVRRLVRIQPGRVLDGREIENSERRVRSSQLFNEVRITVQRPRPDEQDALDTPAATGTETDAKRTEAAENAAANAAAEAATGEKRAEDARQLAGEALNASAGETLVRSEVRDILAEVKERNTGSVNFGVGLGTDSGVFGQFSVAQRNFDIADTPETLDELVTGRAFRGAGQQFQMTIAPGNEISTFSLDFLEPHLLETDYALRVSPFYRYRIYEDYDENRASVPLTLSRKLGDFWTVGVTGAYTWVELSAFDPDTPVEVADDKGPANYVSTGMFLKRTDVDRQFRPSRGSAFDVAVTQFVSFDDIDPFTVFRGGYTQFFTVSEDFLGRRSTLRLSSDVGYILGDDAPVYERFYLGGRTFRGFEFRTISPKSRENIDPATRADDPVGGLWMFFAGAQYEQPIFGSTFSMVGFVDSGTVTDDVGLDAYRVSVGMGVRLYIPQFGPAPLAFDFAVPLVKEDSDETQVFSFSAEIPF